MENVHFSKKKEFFFCSDRFLTKNFAHYYTDGDRDVLKENTDNNNKRHTQEVMSSHSFTRVKGSWEVKTSSAKTKVPSHDSSTLPTPQS